MTHNIFLSYSRKDIDIMRRLRDDLRAAGFTVWTDEGIEPGTPSWKNEIEQAIRASDFQVIVFSPDANTSRWVRAEIDFAETLHKPMFPLLARGDETTSIPFGFSTYQWIDIRQPSDYDTGFRMLSDAIQHKLNLPAGAGARPLQTARIFKQTASTPTPAAADSGIMRRVLYIIGIAATALVALMAIILPQLAPVIVNATPTPPIPTTQATRTPGAQVELRTTPGVGMPATCEIFTSEMAYERVDPPTMTIPDDWVQVKSDNVTLSFPEDYYLSLESDSELYDAIFSTLTGNIFPAITDFGCSWNIEIFFLQIGSMQGGGVMRRRVGLELSPQAQKAYFEEALGDVATLETEYVTLPVGESVLVKLNILNDQMDAKMIAYSFSSGPMLYMIASGFAADTFDEHVPLIAQIAQTFRLVES